MIYSLKNKSSVNNDDLSMTFKEYNEIKDTLDVEIACSNFSVSKIKNINEFEVKIPVAYSRKEKGSKLISYEKLDKDNSIPCYELFVTEQIGTSRNRRDTNIYYKLPKSGDTIRIILHKNQGVSFDPLHHKALLKETDELDRRIIRGFCLKYQSTLMDACYPPYNSREDYQRDIKIKAMYYNCDKMPKRLPRSGDQGVDSSRFWKDLKPYEESNVDCGIFSNVVFI